MFVAILAGVPVLIQRGGTAMVMERLADFTYELTSIGVWLAESWCSVPSVLKVAGSTPLLAATYGLRANPSLIIACMT